MKETATIFTDYLKKTQQLGLNSNPEFVVGYIQNQLDLPQDPFFELLLQGDLAFYTNDYKSALKYYLQVKDITDAPFFCHRASAMLSSELGQKTKALVFANKALKLHPEDPCTLKILEELLKNFDEEKAQQVRDLHDKIRSCKDLESLPLLFSDIRSLAEQNLKELMSAPEKETEELFALGAPSKDKEHKNRTLEDGELTFKSLDSPIAKDMLKEFLTESTLKHRPPPPESLELSRITAMLEEHATSSKLQHPKYSDGLTGRSLESGMILKLEEYSRRYQKLLEDYLEEVSSREKCQDNCLFAFNTWSKDIKDLPIPGHLDPRKSISDGIFLRFKGKGIAINPGRHFLAELHSRSFSLLDINYVIVTHSKREALQDIAHIYDLTSQLNRLLGKPHVIHYYFNRATYQEMIQILKPRYRQEKSSLHCLELYLDTPDVERIELQEGITLGYFLTAQTFNPFSPVESLNLGLKLELQDNNLTRTIAYVSSTHWTPLLGHHIGSVDLLLSGFGTTQPSDLKKERYLDDCLGYYGTLSLLQEAPPTLALLTEFNKTVAGARLEIVKKIREDISTESSETTVLPADPGLNIDLEKMLIQCSITKEWIAPHLAKIVQASDPLGNLQYLSPSSYI
ncbi:tetratricopeptide repeat protein [Estrella lausannensis]|uniref:Tetratricopeptide repeat protein n=1 Tax=Estrella lausannensis TaxID=483423 RepID=A0A0H5E714_9BACT|nr:hypothetical protein [Estrella lausannensis]CRX39090.1 Conserved hypothetical protein [Estrella lausannensis]